MRPEWHDATNWTDIERRCVSVLRPRFRGEVWDFVSQMPMQRSYANGGRPFDIETACYLKPVFRAIKDNNIPVIAVQSAVQTLKTFACIEAAAAYFLLNDPGDMTIYIDSDDSAKDQSRSRTLDYWKTHPEINEMFEEVKRVDQWDITTQEFFLPGMTLRIWPLNVGSTQRVTLRRVLISDAFLSMKTGMLEQAIARTTQHAHDKKIIVESQGGEDGDDMDMFFRSTDMGFLHVICPLCGRGQPFEFSRERPADFVPTPPRDIPSLDHAAWIDRNAPLLRGAFAGFDRGDEVSVKRADGEYNEAEIIRQTSYLCFHCGGRWLDTPATRRALDQSSHYLATNQRALPGHVGFSWPVWINARIPWGGKEVMLGYLRAKKAKDEFNNDEPLKQWYQKRAGRPWNPNLIRILRARVREDYDAATEWPEEWRGRRHLVVDCQYELQHFWGSVWAVSRTGKSRQLWRGLLRGFNPAAGTVWNAVSNETPSVVDVQKHFSISDQFVMLDGGYMKNELVEECAKHGHWSVVNGERAWFCWTLLVGSGQKDFSHKSDGDPKIRHPVSDPFYEYPQIRIGKYKVSVEVYYFSKLQMSQMFARYRDGRGPETLFLPDAESPDNKLSWTAQIHACTPHYDLNKRTGESAEIWRPDVQGRPHHYFDLGTMEMAIHCIWNISGHQQFEEPPGAKPG